MKVEELLELAVALIRVAAENAENDELQAAQVAAITAQAAAMTAQAMMMAQMTDTSTRSNGEEIRVVMVDTGN